eukprot:scaffold6583_cov33-Prasinocladus_malaysianus.AAC.1
MSMVQARVCTPPGRGGLPGGTAGGPRPAPSACGCAGPRGRLPASSGPESAAAGPGRGRWSPASLGRGPSYSLPPPA